MHRVTASSPSSLFFRLSAMAAVGLLAVLLAGCAGAGGEAGSRTLRPVAVGVKDRLYVSLPEVSDTVLTDLAALGWGDGKFQSELRQEILFQFNRKGVATVGDSAAAATFLAVRIDSYGSGGNATDYRGGARLKKAEAEREFEFKKDRSRAEAPARQDPTVDNIRSIAESVVSGAWKAPMKDKPKDQPPVEMWMIF